MNRPITDQEMRDIADGIRAHLPETEEAGLAGAYQHPAFDLDQIADFRERLQKYFYEVMHGVPGWMNPDAAGADGMNSLFARRTPTSAICMQISPSQITLHNYDKASPAERAQEVAAMVAFAAKAYGNPLTMVGDDEFKLAAWKQAVQQGYEVVGYKPPAKEARAFMEQLERQRALDAIQRPLTDVMTSEDAPTEVAAQDGRAAQSAALGHSMELALANTAVTGTFGYQSVAAAVAPIEPQHMVNLRRDGPQPHALVVEQTKILLANGAFESHEKITYGPIEPQHMVNLRKAEAARQEAMAHRDFENPIDAKKAAKNANRAAQRAAARVKQREWKAQLERDRAARAAEFRAEMDERRAQAEEARAARLAGEQADAPQRDEAAIAQRQEDRAAFQNRTARSKKWAPRVYKEIEDDAQTPAGKPGRPTAKAGKPAAPAPRRG